MRGGLLQYLGGVRGGSCALILAFLLLPYLVDVAYYGDLTPTHYAQESLKTNDVARFDAQESLLCADDRAHSREAEFTLQDAGTQCSAPLRAVFPPPQYLSLASLTSRPPPAL